MGNSANLVRLHGYHARSEMPPSRRSSVRRGPFPSSRLTLFLIICGWIGGAPRIFAGGQTGNPTKGEVSSRTSSSAKKAGCWIFTHSRQGSGAGIEEILRNQEAIDQFVYDSPQWKVGNKHAQRYGRQLVTGDGLYVVAGSYTEALRGTVGDSCQWFTLFRHPIPRLVSAYFYCKERPADRVCASDVVRAEDVDLLGFARHWGNFAVRQFALDFVSADEVIEFVKGGGLVREKGDPMDLPGWYLLKSYLQHQGGATGKGEAAVLEGMLEPAMEILSNFTAVGIFEEFSTTLDLYNKVLTLPGLDWNHEFSDWNHEFSMTSGTHVNTEHSEEENTLSWAWTDPKIKGYMNLDLLLYEHAVDVFYDQVRRQNLEGGRADVLLTSFLESLEIEEFQDTTVQLAFSES